MNREEIKSELIDYIVEELLDGDDSVDVAEQENLLLTGILDSLGVMRLVTHLETTLSRRIPHQDITLENFKNIDTISGYLLEEPIVR